MCGFMVCKRLVLENNSRYVCVCVWVYSQMYSTIFIRDIFFQINLPVRLLQLQLTTTRVSDSVTDEKFHSFTSGVEFDWIRSGFIF